MNGTPFTTAPQPPTAPPTELRPPLRRSRDDRVVAGVCGGVGRTLGVDPLLIRVLLVAVTLVGGAGIVAYLVGWLLIPEDGAATSEGQRLVDGLAGTSRPAPTPTTPPAGTPTPPTGRPS